MSGLPDITMVGTVTADPELRFTPSGDAVANWTVACNKRVKNRDTGEWEDRDATFLRCSVWRQTAENVAESVSKGDRVMVTGEIKQRSFETKEGEKRTTFELDVFEVGPSLKFATAEVRKVGRSSGAGGGAAPESDPWASAPDEAPF